MTDLDLIQSCLKGNSDAEKQLFMRYAGKVYTLCRRYVAQDAQAKDLMQDCFIQIFDKLKMYDSTRGEFAGWLHRVCSNVALQQLRKEKREIPIVFPEIMPDFEEEISEPAFDELSNEILLESIRELPNGYQEILNLFIFEGLKHREIAARLNISESTSRSQYARAKKHLKSILESKTNKIKENYEGRLVGR